MICGAHLASHLRKSDLDCSHRQVAWVVKSKEEKQTSLNNYFPPWRLLDLLFDHIGAFLRNPNVPQWLENNSLEICGNMTSCGNMKSFGNLKSVAT